MLGTLGTVDSTLTCLYACVRCPGELQLLQNFLGDFKEGVLKFSFVAPTFPFLLPRFLPLLLPDSVIGFSILTYTLGKSALGTSTSLTSCDSFSLSKSSTSISCLIRRDSSLRGSDSAFLNMGLSTSLRICGTFSLI